MSDRRNRKIFPTPATIYRKYAPDIKTAIERYAESSSCVLELCDSSAVFIDGQNAHFPLKTIQGSVNDVCEIIDEIENDMEIRCKFRLDNTPESNGFCLMITVPLYDGQGNDTWTPSNEKSEKSSKIFHRAQLLIVLVAVFLGMVLHARFFAYY
jgi:hypothetical protein